MRFALVSDIHANLQAWNAVLEDIQTLGIDQIINLGDVVGYGPCPGEVLKSVREASHGSVIGNHDAVCAGRMSASIFNDQARAAIEWTQGRLDEDACHFLKELPEMIRPEGGGFLVTHAEVISPLNFSYILTAEEAERNFAACEDSIIFIGHTHRPGVFLQQQSGEVTLHEPGMFYCDPSLRYIINPGSVGDPRTPEIAACYCIYDSGTRAVEFRQIDFDIDAYRQTIGASGLSARPFFLRYLDAVAEGVEGEIMPPSVETEYVPQFDLSVRMPEPKKAKKKNPLLLAGLLALFLGAAAMAWIVLSNSKQATAAEQVPSIVEQETSPPVIATKFPVTARYIRISNPKGQYLSLAEVKVMSGRVNLARKKHATQSSNFDKIMLASKAVDGKDGGKRENQITHTTDQRPMWWEVDLGEMHEINSVIIWNRDQGSELMKRLDGFTLEAFDEERQPVYRTKKNPGAGLRIQLK